jgi:hypothetical protein
MEVTHDARALMRERFPGYSYATMLLRDPSGRVVPRDSEHLALQHLADRARLEQHSEDWHRGNDAWKAQQSAVAAPDNGSENDAPARPDDDPRMMQPIAVDAVSEIMKAIVRATSAERRISLWNGMSQHLEDAQEHAPDKMPWHSAESVQHITKLAALKVIARSIDELIPDNENRRRLFTVAVKAAGQHEDKSATRPLPRKRKRHKERVCARDGCSEVFTPDRSTGIYHSEACRSRAAKARMRERQRTASGE